MSFFHVKKKDVFARGLSTEFLHRHGCTVCPLNNQSGLRHPHMPAHGTTRPIVYMLGEAPGKDEDREGMPFVGRAGEILHMRIPDDWRPYLRWNNCVRTRPPKNRNPTNIEIECCRPSIVQDIEQTKPFAIFGFGNIPLQWTGLVKNPKGIILWCGRHIPIKVGTHTCWYFPMMHPSYIAHQREFEPRNATEYGHEVEFAFALHLKRAFELVEKLPNPIVHTEEDARRDVEIITGKNGDHDVRRIVEFIRGLYNEHFVGLDYETNAKRPYNVSSKVLSVGLSGPRQTISFPLDHRENVWTSEQREVLTTEYVRFLLSATCRKVAHALAFEMEWSGFKYGKKTLRAQRWEDSMSQAYILDPRRGALSLNFVCKQLFGLSIKELSDVDRAKLDNESLSTVLTYNAIDAKYHRLACIEQMKRLKVEGLLPVYREQLRRTPTVVLTQLKGLPINQKTVRRFKAKYEGMLDVAEAKLDRLKAVRIFKKHKGHDYRPGAAQDVRYLLTKILEYSNDELEKVDEKTLRTIEHPVAQYTVDWRKVNKVLSTYIYPVLKGSPHVYDDRLVHFILSLCKVITWRTSSERPNIQNWPKRQDVMVDVHGKEVRGQVDPGPDMRVVAFDYAGMQARNIAMESKDAALVQAFWDKYDIHGDWLERLLEEWPQWIPKRLLRNVLQPHGDTGINARKLYRDRVKNEFVFPSFFGAIPSTLQYHLAKGDGTPPPERVCEKLQIKLFDMFPDVRKWQDQLKEDYRKIGYVTGLSGFRRYAPISNNELINTPIQGDEVIIVLDAMNRLSEMGKDRYQPSMEIHDDLTFIWPKRDIERNAEVVVNEMIYTPFKWAHNVPLVVEMSVGKNWASLQGAGEFSSDGWNGRVRLPKGLRVELSGDNWEGGEGWQNVEKHEKADRARRSNLPPHMF